MKKKYEKGERESFLLVFIVKYLKKTMVETVVYFLSERHSALSIGEYVFLVFFHRMKG